MIDSYLPLPNTGHTQLTATVTDREKSDAQGQGINKLIWLIKNSGRMLVLAAIYGTPTLTIIAIVVDD